VKRLLLQIFYTLRAYMSRYIFSLTGAKAFGVATDKACHFDLIHGTGPPPTLAEIQPSDTCLRTGHVPTRYIDPAEGL
jgi:hypothetical protein